MGTGVFGVGGVHNKARTGNWVCGPPGTGNWEFNQFSTAISRNWEIVTVWCLQRAAPGFADRDRMGFNRRLLHQNQSM